MKRNGFLCLLILSAKETDPRTPLSAREILCFLLRNTSPNKNRATTSSSQSKSARDWHALLQIWSTQAPLCISKSVKYDPSLAKSDPKGVWSNLSNTATEISNQISFSDPFVFFVNHETRRSHLLSQHWQWAAMEASANFGKDWRCTPCSSIFFPMQPSPRSFESRPFHFGSMKWKKKKEERNEVFWPSKTFFTSFVRTPLPNTHVMKIPTVASHFTSLHFHFTLLRTNRPLVRHYCSVDYCWHIQTKVVGPSIRDWITSSFRKSAFDGVFFWQKLEH